jgi:hypothetical protein
VFQLALVECSLCQKQVNSTAKNYIFANGIHQHKKCPKAPVLSEQEKTDKDELYKAIEWAFVHKPLGDKGLNWVLISKQVKDLKDKGHSYQDQLFAFKWLVDKDGGYWGYGRVEKFIAQAMENKRRREEFEQSKAEQLLVPNESKLEPSTGEQSRLRDVASKSSKPSFLNMGDDTLDL